VDARIRNLDDAHVGLDRAEGIVLGGDAGPRQRVEKRGLANVRQAHDATFQAHRTSLLVVCSAIIAASMSPAAIEGHAPSARPMASCHALRSSARGGFST